MTDGSGRRGKRPWSNLTTSRFLAPGSGLEGSQSRGVSIEQLDSCSMLFLRDRLRTKEMGNREIYLYLYLLFDKCKSTLPARRTSDSRKSERRKMPCLYSPQTRPVPESGTASYSVPGKGCTYGNAARPRRTGGPTLSGDEKKT